MAIPRNPSKPKLQLTTRRFLFLSLSITAIAFLFIFSSSNSTSGFQPSSSPPTFFTNLDPHKYLYWGHRIDCPGKYCDTCAGLGHQESSLRCALEEAFFLQRTFVMPARMCINPVHNKKGLLHQSTNASSDEGWMATSCAMDTLYDIELISEKIPVILDDSEMWQGVLSTSMKLGARTVAQVEGVTRQELREDRRYANLLLINRTTSPLAWFAECKDRKNHSAILLPYSYLPTMAAKKLRDAADKIKMLLGDFDAMHVRRGDILKTRKDKFGVHRSKHPHVDRDTRPNFILQRIKKWIPPRRTLFIASNERTPRFFTPLAVRYNLADSSNYSEILDPVVENNYQLFMIERLIMMGAKTMINTFKGDDSEYSLTDDPKKNNKNWQKPIYTFEEEEKRVGINSS